MTRLTTIPNGAAGGDVRDTINGLLDSSSAGTIAGRGIFAPTPSPQYVSFPLFRGAPSRTRGDGNAPDQSGFGGDVINDTLNGAGAWANAGYYTTQAIAGGGGFIARRKANFNLASQWVLFAFRVNAAAPAANAFLMGNGSLAGGTNFQGISILARTNGKIRIAVNTDTNGGNTNTTTDSTATVLDGTDHDVFVFVHGPSGNIYVEIDGNYDAGVSGRGLFTGGTPNITGNWNFGFYGVGPNTLDTQTPMAAKFAAFHMLVGTGRPPVALGEIVRKLRAFPNTPIAAADTMASTLAIAFTIVGQSNEWGAGTSPSAGSNYGCIQYDPLPGVTGRGGGVQSMWPYLGALLGRRGVWGEFWNAAQGSTSIVHNWAGIAKTWTNGMSISTPGTYVLPGNGYVYKALPSPNLTGAGGAAAGTATPSTKTNVLVATSTVAPSGTTVGGTETGSDNILWQNMRAVTAADVADHVYTVGDALFDPVGYLADSLSTIKSATGTGPKPGYDVGYALVSIGQGDKSLATVRAIFAAGYKAVTDYFLANGIKVALGFTCRATTSGADDWYNNQLVPGVEDAIASYANNANVVRGANLFSALGALTNVTYKDQRGLNASDSVHMTNVTIPEGSEAWDAALFAAGVVPARLF
jgi:hypothetical protein